MGRVVEFSFPAANTTAVAPLQTDAGSPFVFSLAPYDGTNDSTRYPPGVIDFSNMARTISLTSLNNNSLVNFTFVGTDIFGNPLTETRSGPNANTVETTGRFKTLTSIIPSAAYSAVSAGTGSMASIAPIQLDPYPAVISWAINVNVTGTITYSVVGTLSRLHNPTGRTLALIVGDTFAINAALTSATTDQYYTSTQQVAALLISVDASSGGSLTGQVLQQGGGY